MTEDSEIESQVDSLSYETYLCVQKKKVTKTEGERESEMAIESIMRIRKIRQKRDTHTQNILPFK